MPEFLVEVLSDTKEIAFIYMIVWLKDLITLKSLVPFSKWTHPAAAREISKGLGWMFPEEPTLAPPKEAGREGGRTASPQFLFSPGLAVLLQL